MGSEDDIDNGDFARKQAERHSYDDSGKRRYGLGSLITAGVLSVATTLGIGYFVFLRPLGNKSELNDLNQGERIITLENKFDSLSDTLNQYISGDHEIAINWDSVKQIQDINYRIADLEDSVGGIGNEFSEHTNNYNIFKSNTNTELSRLDENDKKTDLRLNDFGNDVKYAVDFVDEENTRRVISDVMADLGLNADISIGVHNEKYVHRDGLGKALGDNGWALDKFTKGGFPEKDSIMALVNSSGAFSKEGAKNFYETLEAKPEIYSQIISASRALVKSRVDLSEILRNPNKITNNFEVDKELVQNLVKEHMEREKRYRILKKGGQTHAEAAKE